MPCGAWSWPGFVLWVTAQVVAIYAPILSKQLLSLMACTLLVITDTWLPLRRLLDGRVGWAAVRASRKRCALASVTPPTHWEIWKVWLLGPGLTFPSVK